MRKLNVDILMETRRLLEYSVLPSVEMIVDLDAGYITVFERKYEFAIASPIPIFGVSQLIALPGTLLHSRLSKESGSQPDLDGGSETVPKRISSEMLK